jgi:hypothetical protein
MVIESGAVPRSRHPPRVEHLEREGWAAQRPQGEGEQGQLVVVPGGAVGPERAATCAAVDDRPLAVPSDLDADRLHRAAAGAAAIAWLLIEVPGPQAVGAVVAVLGAVGTAVHGESTSNAGEPVKIGSGLSGHWSFRVAAQH